MKRIAFILIWLLQVTASMAGSYQIVFNTGYTFLEITDVQQSDTNTIVTFQNTLKNAVYVKIPSQLQICDQERKLYPARSINDCVFSSDSILTVDAKSTFRIEFAPVSSQLRIFDIYSDNELFPTFAFWGVHSSTEDISGWTAWKDDVCITEEYITPGEVVIEGKIEDYKEGESQNGISLRLMHLVGPNSSTNISAKILPDGTFTFKTTIGGHLWTHLLYENCAIPVYLVPNEGIHVTVENTSKRITHYEYTSGKHYVQNLLRADRFFVLWEWQDLKEVNINLYKERAMNAKDNLKKLCAYLKHKHDMSDYEAHLLYVNFSDMIDENLFSCVNYTLQTRYSRDILKDMSKEELKEIALSADLQQSYSFLGDINTNDMSHFIVPSRMTEIVRHIYVINQIYPMVPIDFNASVLDGYYHQVVNTKWKERR